MSNDEKTARRLLDDELQRLRHARATMESDLAEERPGTGAELADYDQHPAEQGTEVSYFVIPQRPWPFLSAQEG